MAYETRSGAQTPSRWQGGFTDCDPRPMESPTSLALALKREIEACSDQAHALARRRHLLLDAIRDLAVGSAPAVVIVTLREKGVVL